MGKVMWERSRNRRYNWVILVRVSSSVANYLRNLQNKTVKYCHERLALLRLSP